MNSPEGAEAAELARQASRACSPESRPLYAGHTDLEWPEQPHLQLRHAISLLREFRGDGHIMALQRAGLSGVHALVLQIFSGEGLSRSSPGRAAAGASSSGPVRDALREQDLLDEDGVVSGRGATLWEEIESATDELALAPWSDLGPERADRLINPGK